MTGQDELEGRYRRLMTWYPWWHRREYEEEMVTVLLAGAAPGQRRPGARDRADLLLNAVAVRLRGWAGGSRRDDWRRAAYAVQVFGAMLMSAVGARRVAALLTTGAPVAALDVTRPLCWALVVVAALLRLRRSAAGLALLGAAAEVVAVAGRYEQSPPEMLRSTWLVTVALLVAAVSVRLAGVATVARPRGLWWFAAALGCAACGVIIDERQEYFHGVDYGVYISGTFIFRYALPLYLLAAVLGGRVWWRQGRPVRRRLLAFAAPVVATAAVVAYGFAGFLYSSQRFDTPILLAPVQWVVLAATPVSAFLLAVLVLDRWERIGALVELGRRAERDPGAPGAG